MAKKFLAELGNVMLLLGNLTQKGTDPLIFCCCLLPLILLVSCKSQPFGTDKVDLTALWEFVSSETPPTTNFRSPGITARFIGKGEMTTGSEEPQRGYPPDDILGVSTPDEAPEGEVEMTRQVMRVFNSATQFEFEITVSGTLLQTIHRSRVDRGLTSATKGVSDPDSLERTGRPESPKSAKLPNEIGGIVDLIFGVGEAWAGWSNAHDSRQLLTSTTLWPWRAIADSSTSCTGTLIGPRHIITAAHCIVDRGTNNWKTRTFTPGRNGPNSAPFGSSQISPTGGGIYFTPSEWRNPNLTQSEANQWDWGLIVIPDSLGDQTGWMGYVARPGSQLSQVAHYNRGYPRCNADAAPDGCEEFEDLESGSTRLYGGNICTLGGFSWPGPDGWNRVIHNSCDISGGQSGSAVYHYFFDSNLGQTVPVVSMVEFWEDCFTCSAANDTPNRARRITPSDLGTISFYREWFP